MNLWQILGAYIEAIVLIVLMEALPVKDVSTPDGANLGTAADIKPDLMRTRLWVIVEHKGWCTSIPSKQIASLNEKK